MFRSYHHLQAKIPEYEPCLLPPLCSSIRKLRSSRFWRGGYTILALGPSVHRIRTLTPRESWLQSSTNLNSSIGHFTHRRAPSVLTYGSSRYFVPSVYFTLTVRKSQTSGSWVLLENPIIHQLAKTFSAFCGSRKLVPVLCWASRFRSTSPHTILLRSIFLCHHFCVLQLVSVLLHVP
jgi:hypothetical protein